MSGYYKAERPFGHWKHPLVLIVFIDNRLTRQEVQQPHLPSVPLLWIWISVERQSRPRGVHRLPQYKKSLSRASLTTNSRPASRFSPVIALQRTMSHLCVLMASSLSHCFSSASPRRSPVHFLVPDVSHHRSCILLYPFCSRISKGLLP